ncbi:MAG: pyridoxamine kinase [Ruminococcaceae bacterium]|nr:pyridoxamine kinase [Oscillospiraceae bacterium]
MNRIPRVAAVNDLSGFGRCSLSVAMPILSAMGFQVCPLPTVLLSAHTGYPDPHIRDFTEDMPAYLSHWNALSLDFEAVYTGFLGNEQQEQLLQPLLARAKETGVLRVVDPAMADHGQLYATCTPALIDAMRQLVSLATVTTPNLTEACLLAGEDYDRIAGLKGIALSGAVKTVGETLLSFGCQSAVITGVPGEGDTIVNFVLDGTGCEQIASPAVMRTYAGTGDVFSSVLCGHLMRGTPLTESVARTAAFVHKVTAYTASLDLPEQDGVVFEPFLREGLDL